MSLIKSLITKIKEKFKTKVAEKVTENMTPVSGTIIHLEKPNQGKYQYKIIVKDNRNRTIMLKVKNKVKLNKGDKIQGYFAKEDRTAVIKIA